MYGKQNSHSIVLILFQPLFISQIMTCGNIIKPKQILLNATGVIICQNKNYPVSLRQMKQSISVNVRVQTEVISHEHFFCFLSFHLPKLQNGLA